MIELLTSIKEFEAFGLNPFAILMIVVFMEILKRNKFLSFLDKIANDKIEDMCKALISLILAFVIVFPLMLGDWKITEYIRMSIYSCAVASFTYHRFKKYIDPKNK